jgi:hypothetical protein
MPSYLSFKQQPATYQAFLSCLATTALNGLPATSTHTPIAAIRDSTYQNFRLPTGSVEDHFIRCLAAVALGVTL